MYKIFEITEYVPENRTSVTCLKIGTDEISVLLDFLEKEYDFQFGVLIENASNKPKREDFSSLEEFLEKNDEYEYCFGDIPSKSDFIIHSFEEGLSIKELTEIDGHKVIVC